MQQRKSTWATGIGIFFLFIAPQLSAQEDLVKKRKDLMQSNSAAVKAITKAVQEKDYGTVEAKAKEIAGNMNKAGELFPKGSITEKSRAHPDIWQKGDEFTKDATKVTKAAEALGKAAAAKNDAEVNLQVKALGNPREGACGNCHKTFRTDFRKEAEKKGG
jgi:cytochrome c556